MISPYRLQLVHQRTTNFNSQYFKAILLDDFLYLVVPQLYLHSLVYLPQVQLELEMDLLQSYSHSLLSLSMLLHLFKPVPQHLLFLLLHFEKYSPLQPLIKLCTLDDVSLVLILYVSISYLCMLHTEYQFHFKSMCLVLRVVK